MFEFGIGIFCIVVVFDFYLGFKQQKKIQKLKKENLAYKEEINGLKLEIMELISKKERKEPDKAIQGIVDYLRNTAVKKEKKVNVPNQIIENPVPIMDDYLTRNVLLNLNSLPSTPDCQVKLFDSDFGSDSHCHSDHSDHACCEHGSDSSCSDSSSDSSSDCSCSPDP